LSLVNDFFDQRYFNKWHINRDEITTKLLELKGDSSFEETFKTLYINYPSFYPKEDIQLIGDKNPDYGLYIKRLNKLYPESKFVLITRDYRDNYLSLIKVNFEVPVIPLVVFRWRFVIEQFLKLRRKNKNRFYHLRYEDLVQNPGRTFQAVCDFLEINYIADVLDYYDKKEEWEKAYQDDPSMFKIHQSMLKPINLSRMGLWEEGMTEKQIKAADHVAGKMAEKMGYSRKYQKYNIWLAIKFFPLLLHARTIYWIIIFGERLPYRLRNSLLKMLGVIVKVYWWAKPGKTGEHQNL
jgi:hypothetical protein